jgi:transposase
VCKALEGDYRSEHLFVLGQALAAYRFTVSQIEHCDQETLARIGAAASGASPVPLQNPKKFESVQDRSLAAQTAQLLGVDLTSIEGVSAWAASNLASEIGCDIAAWPTEKHFASWLGLCPDNRISGGKVLGSSTRHVPSRANYIVRMCAYGAVRSKGPLGEYYRKMRARLGPAQALIATAHKLARLIYRCLKTRMPYSPEQIQADQRRAELARFHRLTKQAQAIGFALVPKQATCRPSGKNRMKTPETPENEHHTTYSAATA